ncbi:hypothetical protein ABW20_dc0103835 [Dactylellina cionopaga]|nr:hypothetical protein ABW20_dc0103835 [Dactylellina cionopaga]
MQQIGDNGQVTLPPDTLYFGYGSCVADLRGSGSGVSVAAGSLFASFNQLVARCQHGWFFYDSGWINAELSGHSGWKKRSLDIPYGPRPAPPREETLDKLRERQRQSKFTWNTTEVIPHHSDVVRLGEHSLDDKNITESNSTLSKRQDWRGVEIFRFDNGDPNNFFVIWRFLATGVAQPPSDPNFLADTRVGIWDMMSLAYAVADHTIRGSAGEALIDGHTNSIAMTAALGLSFRANGWRSAMLGIGGLTNAYFVGTVMFDDWKLQASQTILYQLTDRYGNLIWRFTINSVIGTTSALPPS